MQDAVASLSPESQALYGKGSLDSLLYADDTLIVGVAQERVQELLDAVAATGLKYGMELHWSKFQLLQVRGKYKLSAPDGSVIEPTEMMSVHLFRRWCQKRAEQETGRWLVRLL